MAVGVSDLFLGHPFSTVRFSSCSDGSFLVSCLSFSSFVSDMGRVCMTLTSNSSVQMSLASSGRYARDRVSATTSSFPGRYFTVIGYF